MSEKIILPSIPSYSYIWHNDGGYLCTLSHPKWVSPAGYMPACKRKCEGCDALKFVTQREIENHILNSLPFRVLYYRNYFAVVEKNGELFILLRPTYQKRFLHLSVYSFAQQREIGLPRSEWKPEPKELRDSDPIFYFLYRLTEIYQSPHPKWRGVKVFKILPSKYKFTIALKWIFGFRDVTVGKRIASFTLRIYSDRVDVIEESEEQEIERI